MSLLRAGIASWMRVGLLLFPLLASVAGADELSQKAGTLLAREKNVSVSEAAGDPPIGMISRDGEAFAYYASSYNALGTIGYSGKPVDVLVIVDRGGKILAASLLSHVEPILTLGVAADALERYVDGFTGVDVRQSVRALNDAGTMPDAVSGATVSSGVIRDAILRTGRIALESGTAGKQRPSAPSGAPASWQDLVGNGTVTYREIGFGEARDAMPAAATIPQGEGVYAAIAAAIINNAATGEALLGKEQYGKLATEFSASDKLLFVAARGAYSVKGTAWKKTGVFERLELASGGKAALLPAGNHQPVDSIAASGAPEFRERFVAAIPPSAGIGPGAPATLTLIVDKTREGAAAPARFSMELAAGPAAQPTSGEKESAAPLQPAEEPLWLENWRQAVPELVILAIMLTTLFVALYISGPIVRRPRLYEWFRGLFLLVTLVWLGWIAGAQLSVVQLVAFTQSLMTGFRWEVFLLGPLIFVLWAFVALGILFWGRGVFCGWLCPFGALQELTHKAGQKLGIKRIEIPWEVHERLWPIKYVALLAILGLSLQDTALAFTAAEIEPFKTAIVMHFGRPWPFVLFVVAILVAGLFVERIFCRYLCPLGAALAIPSKFKIFDWLIRRPQCGRECRLCATTCTVQAIDPIGRINPNECIYCLKCQVNYYDPETCVPLKIRAHRRPGGAQAETGGSAAASSNSGT